MPGFAVTDADRPDVIRLCRRLDGIPLAVELAAVRVRALPLAELAERLEARFSVLTGARRGTVPRHQTLRAAIEWSYGLCTEAEQTVWNRLSVFAGPFDLAAARDVAACPQVPRDRVGDVLAGLVDKSVVLRVTASAGLAGDRPGTGCSARSASTRRSGSPQSGQEAECRRRHARRYLTMARSFLRHLLADDQAARLRELRAEHADVSAVLEYGFAADEPGWERDATRLAAALLPYWLMSGRLREGIHWQDAIRSRRASREPSAEAGERAGRPGRARRHARIARGRGARPGGHRRRRADRRRPGPSARLPRAAARARSARRLPGGGRGGRRRRGGASPLSARTSPCAASTSSSGRPIRSAGTSPRPTAAGQRALAGLGPGERWLHGYVLIISALALYRQPGRQPECAGAAGEALRAMHDLGNPVGEACALDVLGWLAADAGRFERAAWLLGAAQTRWERAGGRLGGNAVMEGHRARSAAAAARALGAGRYAELHARGAGRRSIRSSSSPSRAMTRCRACPRRGAAWDDRAGCGGRARAAPGRPAGRRELTSREREIAALVALGLSNRDIADRLFISRRTVDAHVNHIFAKLRISSRVQLTIWERDRRPGAAPTSCRRQARIVVWRCPPSADPQPARGSHARR